MKDPEPTLHLLACCSASAPPSASIAVPLADLFLDENVPEDVKLRPVPRASWSSVGCWKNLRRQRGPSQSQHCP